ncbi:MAG: putative copper resistance protein D [Patiriisocius sp.]|jgi:putative copper resistance protein D
MSQPAICCGDQLRCNFIATNFANPLFSKSLHDFGRFTRSHAAISALFALYTLLSPLFTLIVILLLSISFTLSGHTNTLGFGSVTLITLHVALAFAWLGSLVPLIHASYSFSNNELYLVMDRFGRYVSWGVAILLIAGTVMLVLLVPSIEVLFSSAYGQLFVLKIVGVLLLLVFAIVHKFFVVPHILQKDMGHIKLRHSIIAEACIGLLVLCTTNFVTTAVGPVMQWVQLINLFTVYNRSHL